MGDARTRIALRFLESHPEEGAALLEAHPAEQGATALREAGPAIAAEVVRRGVPSFAVGWLQRLSAAEVGAILDRMPAGEAADLLRRVDEAERESWLDAMQGGAARAARRALPYGDGTAGALMDARASALPSDLRVAEAVDLLRRERQHSAYYLYVVDRSDRLLGVVSYRDLLLADPGAAVASIMRTSATSVPAESAGDALVEHAGWRRFLALPVVDADGRLVGALRHDVVLAHAAAHGSDGRREPRPWWRRWRRRRDAGTRREETP